MLTQTKSIIIQVIHAARANAAHNHGLDPERLLIGMYTGSFVSMFALKND